MLQNRRNRVLDYRSSERHGAYRHGAGASSGQAPNRSAQTVEIVVEMSS